MAGSVQNTESGFKIIANLKEDVSAYDTYEIEAYNPKKVQYTLSASIVAGSSNKKIEATVPVDFFNRVGTWVLHGHVTDSGDSSINLYGEPFEITVKRLGWVE